MKIISKFSDYYDSVLAHTQNVDDGNIYLRLPETIELYATQLNELKSLLLLCSNRTTPKMYETQRFIPSGYFSYSTFILGFCGKFYPIVQITKDEKSVAILKEQDFSYFIKDYPRIEKEYTKTRRHMYNRQEYQNCNSYQECFDTFFRLFYQKSLPLKNDNLFFEFDTPCFLIETLNCSQSYRYMSGHIKKNVKIHKNPNLNMLNVQHIIDPYTAYQELDMYLSGVLGANSPKTQEISDKNMRDKKGFDDWSFKKLPSKKNKLKNKKKNK